MKASRALGALVLLAYSSVSAQVVGGAGHDPAAQMQADMARQAEIMGIEQQYRDAIDSTNNEISQQQLAFGQCKVQEQMAVSDAEQAASQAKAQAIAGGIQQMAPALSGLSGGAKEKTEEAKTNKKRAAEDLSSKYGITASGSSVATSKCTGSPKISTCRATPTAAGCEGISLDDCKQLVRDYEDAAKDAEGGGFLSHPGTQAAIAGAVAAFGGMMAVNAAKDSAESAKQAAQQARKACEQGIQLALDSLNKKLARLNDDKQKALLNASMQRTIANLNPNTNVDVNPNGFIPDGGAPVGGSAGSDALAGLPPGGGSAGGGGGGSGGGGGGGGAGGGDGGGWTFGGGGGGGGLGSPLPPQPEGESYANTDGGGFVGAGGPGGEEGLAGDGFFAMDAGADGEGGGIGDGGLHVLMARMRGRLIAHSAELVRSVDLQKMANNRAVTPTEKKAPERVPQAQSLRGVSE